MPAAAKGQMKIAMPDAGEVSALWSRPENARWLLVLAHGAGAGMRHPFLEKLTAELAAVGIANFRYQFPYMEQRRRAPDSPPVLKSTRSEEHTSELQSHVNLVCRLLLG